MNLAREGAMVKTVQAWWRVQGARIHMAMGLWLLNRRLDLIEWRFRLETFL